MIMRKILFSLLTTFVVAFVHAQTYEVGAMIGVSNYVGDVGNTTFIRPQDTGFGILAKWNRSKRHSFRFSAAYIPISASDPDSSDPLRQQRAYFFDNSVKEISLGIEYTFWEWDLHTGEKQMVPYMYTGITVINHGDLARRDFISDTGVPSSEFLAFDDTWSMAIPIVLGIKTNIGRHFIVGFELGARYTFTDNLDGSNPENLNLPFGSTNLNFGNLNNNDWYFFNSLTLTYTFGRRPCYCIF